MPTITYLPQAITDGSGLSGVVHSVALSLPAVMTVSGSPVTDTGTLTGTLASQAANKIWAGPVSGGATSPAFRSLVEADIPQDMSTGQIITLTIRDSDDTNPALVLIGGDSSTDHYIYCEDFNTNSIFTLAYNGAITALGGHLMDAAQDHVVLTVKGHSTQTSNLQEWKNNADSVVVSISNAGVITGVGSGLTTLNASNISSGSLADARLSSNVVLENIANAFTVGGHTITNNSDVTALSVKGNASQASVLFTVIRSNNNPLFNVYHSGYTEIIARESINDVLLVSGDAQTISGRLLSVVDGAGGVFGIGPTGQIQTTQVEEGNTPGSVISKLPIYDDGNNLIGYIPLYDQITS